MDNRAYRRVRLRLPVRMRWTTPFGQNSAISETIDVSRGGLLIATPEAHLLGTPVWVTCPYDPLAPAAQPEIAARIVRLAPRATEPLSPNGSHGVKDRTVALEILATARGRAGNGRGHQPERRNAERRQIALAVRVRPPQFPWFEEVMTLDASASGVRFVTSREYRPGDALALRFANGPPAGWPRETEVRTQVIRVQPVGSGASLAVAVERRA
jgi:hypothetical protein